MKKTFSGVLGTPISPRPVLLSYLHNEAKFMKFLNANAEEDANKLRLLCQHYDILEGAQMFRALSLALAREFVPGFQERKALGRPSKWTMLNKGALVVEIERLTERAGTARRVSWAAKQLAKREPWKSFIESKETGQTNPDPAEVLRNAYQDFKGDRFANVSRKAFKWYQHNDTVHLWDAAVTDFVRNPHPD